MKIFLNIGVIQEFRCNCGEIIATQNRNSLPSIFNSSFLILNSIAGQNNLSAILNSSFLILNSQNSLILHFRSFYYRGKYAD
jgi:hypothetical protein